MHVAAPAHAYSEHAMSVCTRGVTQLASPNMQLSIPDGVSLINHLLVELVKVVLPLDCIDAYAHILQDVPSTSSCSCKVLSSSTIQSKRAGLGQVTRLAQVRGTWRAKTYKKNVLIRSSPVLAR